MARLSDDRSDTYRRLDLNFKFALPMVVVESLVHDQDSLNWIGQDEGVVLVAALLFWDVDVSI